MSSDASPVSPGTQHDARVHAGRSLKAVFDELAQAWPERQVALEQALLALVSREHLLVFGPPGTGKSELAAAILRRVVGADGQPSVYARQVVETTVQSDLVGPVDFKVLTETGRTVHLLEEGILRKRYTVLDEVFDGRDLLLRSILSVLNERELALGPVVHKAELQSAFLTTNRYLSEVLAARPDTLQAFTDRIAFSCFVPKSFALPDSRDHVLKRAANLVPPLAKTVPFGALDALAEAVHEVEFPDDARQAMSELVNIYDKLLFDLAAEKKGFVPTTFLSPRTLAKAVGVLRASVVVDRYVRGTDRPLRVSGEDLAALKLMFCLGGPLPELVGKVAEATRDAREKAQLDHARSEATAFDRALAIVVNDARARVDADAKKVGLPELKLRTRALDAAHAPDLALRCYEGLQLVKSTQAREELRGIARQAAQVFAAAARDGRIPPLGVMDRATRLRACVFLADLLHEQPQQRALALAVANMGLTEAVAALEGIAVGTAGAEFEIGAAGSVADLTERARGLDRQIGELYDVADALLRAGGLPDGSRRLEDAEQKARQRTALALRRRAMVKLGGQSRAAESWTALHDASRTVEALDAELEKLAPGYGKVRSHLLAGRVGLLLNGEIGVVAGGRLHDLAAVLETATQRMQELGVDTHRAMRMCRPGLERALLSFADGLRSVHLPETSPNESDYLNVLLKQCASAQNRLALGRVAQLAHLEGNRIVADLDMRLAELDLHELSAQVSYLARWLEDVMRKVPSPDKIVTVEQAEAAWATVSASRFFAVGWRDEDLAALQGRVVTLSGLPKLEQPAKRLLEALNAVSNTADTFGRGLLERRAELAAAA